MLPNRFPTASCIKVIFSVVEWSVCRHPVFRLPRKLHEARRGGNKADAERLYHDRSKGFPSSRDGSFDPRGKTDLPKEKEIARRLEMPRCRLKIRSWDFSDIHGKRENRRETDDVVNSGVDYLLSFFLFDTSSVIGQVFPSCFFF